MQNAKTHMEQIDARWNQYVICLNSVRIDWKLDTSTSFDDKNEIRMNLIYNLL